MKKSNAPVKKKLRSVSIGPYKLDLGDIDRKPVPVTSASVSTADNALYDPKMGTIDKLTNKSCRQDYPACFGTNGIIPLNTLIVHPAAEAAMLSFLKLFKYNPTNDSLEIISSIHTLVSKHRNKSGMRKFAAIVSEAKQSGSWFITPTGGVQYIVKDDEYNISGQRLHDILSNMDEPDKAITYAQLGINTEISRPENWIVGQLVVLNNPLRAPMPAYGSNETSKHPYTEQYEKIVKAAGDLSSIKEVREQYIALLKGWKSRGRMEKNIEGFAKEFFSSNKNEFIRSKMFAKVGGNIARTVVSPNPKLRPDQIGVPRRLAKDVSKRVPITKENIDLVSELILKGVVTHLWNKDVGYIPINKTTSDNIVPGGFVLRQLSDGDVVLINRQPTLHRNSMLGFEVVLHDEDTFQVHPAVTKGFGMDFVFGVQQSDAHLGAIPRDEDNIVSIA